MFVSIQNKTIYISMSSTKEIVLKLLSAGQGRCVEKIGGEGST